MKSWHPLLVGFSSFLLPLASVPAQGTLAPPGAPAATMKSLDQLDAKLEPRVAINATNTPGSTGAIFVISAPGSYYLTGNFTGVSGKAGILVSADDVSIDLRGFTMTGVAGATFAFSIGARSRVSVRDGIVRNWPSDGVVATGSIATRVTGVTSELNGSNGIFVGEAGVVTDCISRGNTGTAAGIITGLRSVVVRCAANSNAVNGISAGGESQVSDCIASTNGAFGISFSGNSGRASACTVTSNGTNGINHTSGGAVIERCVVRSNGATGIAVGADCLVTHCTASSNADGIVCSGQSYILSNICNSNNNAGAGAGIRVSGPRGRVAGNVCALNDLGVVTTVSGILVIRNQCQTNSGANYSLTGTGAGPLVTAANIAANTNPHANFDF